MHILVLNGSPKGEYSITLQTVRFLEILYKEDTFEVLHVGQKIRSIEKDFSSAKEALENNLGIWLTPAMNIHRSPLCGRNF